MSNRRWAIALTATISCVASLAVPAVASARPAPGVPPTGGSAAPGRSLCAPPADTVGPVITRVTFSRASMDLDSGSRVQHVTVTAADSSGKGAASGIARISLSVQGKRYSTGVKLAHASGSRVSGTWTGQFTVSKYAHAGTFSIDYLSVIDSAGNEQDYTGYGTVPEGPNALSLHPADNPTFTVTGTPAKRPPRKSAGRLSALALSPADVNTTSSARRVHIAAKFHGGAAPHRVSVGFDTAKKSGKTRFVSLGAVLHRHHGTWTGTVKVPRWTGKQSLQLYVSAEYGSRFRPSGRFYDPDHLQQLHLPSTLAVVSGVDKTKPRLKSVSFSPTSIDSTNGTERITVTARAKDTRSGVKSIDVDGGIRHGVNGVAAGAYPLASAGVGFLSSDDFHVRLKKTASGAWVGTTTIRQCVPSGTYQLQASVTDAAGNGRYYSTKALAKAHITSTIHVTSKHGDVAPPYVYSAATYGADSELFLNFSEGVANVNTSTLTVFPLTPASTRYAKAAAITGLTCANGTATVDCSGADGLVTSAVLKVPALKSGEKYDVYANLNQVTPQLADGNRNPMEWNYLATDVQDS